MAVESAADRAAFFDADEFGVSATWTPSGGDPSTVTGIFDDVWALAQAGLAGVSSSVPTFMCRTADVSGVAVGDALTVSAVSYTVRDVQPDGTGITTLILERV